MTEARQKPRASLLPGVIALALGSIYLILLLAVEQQRLIIGLLAFAADAYLNEMGITNRLQKTEVTTICNPPVTTSLPNNDPTKITEPNSLPDPADNSLEDIDHFASFMRSLKAPARDETAAATPNVKHGAEVFTRIGCASCHVETIVTGNSPASPGGPGLHPDALQNRTIHPYSDFLLHNVGTGDGIAIALVEHFSRERVEKRMREESAAAAVEKTPSGKTEDECSESYQTAVAEGEHRPRLLRDTLCARNKIRTAPLWGLRLRSRPGRRSGSSRPRALTPRPPSRRSTDIGWTISLRTSCARRTAAGPGPRRGAP